MKILTRLVDAVLGPRCRFGCGQRVFPRDTFAHEQINHAGDHLSLKMREFARAADNFTAAVRAMYRGPGEVSPEEDVSSRRPFWVAPDPVVDRIVAGEEDAPPCQTYSRTGQRCRYDDQPQTCEYGARINCTDDQAADL